LQKRIKNPQYGDVYFKQNLLQKILEFSLKTFDCKEILSIKLNFTSKYFIHVISYLIAEANETAYTLEAVGDKIFVKGVFLEAKLFEVEGLVHIAKKRLKELTSV